MFQWLRYCAAYALLATVSVGCGGGTEPVRTHPAPGGALSASFVQDRPDEGTRRAAIRLTNTSPGPVLVRTVDLMWNAVRPGHSGTPYRLAPGATIDYDFVLGQPRCRVRPGRPRALVTTPDGSQVVALDRFGSRSVRDLWERLCGSMLVHRTVSLTYGSWRRVDTPSDPALAAALLVRRVGSTHPSVSVRSISGSVLLDVRPRYRDRPLLRLSPPDEGGRVQLLVTTQGRCDSHSLSQSRQTFLFRVGVVVGTTTVVLNTTPSRTGRAAAQRFLNDVCGVEER